MRVNLPTLSFASRDDWEAWLEENHQHADGVWLKLAKKNAGVASVSLDEAQEAAVCFGWIDGLAATVDETFWLLRFTPRRPKSRWSAKNRERAMRLAAEGRLRPAGLREVESAKREGRWDRASAPQRPPSN